MINILNWLNSRCSCLLALIFLYSGYVKLQAPLQFAVAIAGYKMVPENLIFPLATYLPWIEIALGLGILIGWKIRYFSMGAAALLLFFMVVLTITISRGIEANCGCFALDERISPKTIARDSLILIPALYLAVEPRLRKRWQKSTPASTSPTSGN
jgi:uncharacterized membrane protein YphA (DoxX/SURF4 family)